MKLNNQTTNTKDKRLNGKRGKILSFRVKCCDEQNKKVSNSNKSRQCLETFHARNISDRIGVKSNFQIKATGFIWDKRRIVYWLNGDYRLMLPVCERIQMRARRRRRDPESRWNRYQRLCCRSGCPRIETRPCGNQTFLFASWKCGGTTIKLYPIQIGWFTSPCKPKLAVQIFSREKCNNNKQKKRAGESIVLSINSVCVERKRKWNQHIGYAPHSEWQHRFPTFLPYTVTVESVLPHRMRGCAICYCRCYYPLQSPP